ncbi:MAG TPA: uracil-DNA glycosylase [Pirellulaceae bacterium]|nr:uracil-DNA glycosylase [Pirellulaceae bacterium]HMO91401.1 uracil-DNA glycosylase [Pirellulaceae bacterium]HMP69626.1 uracil-DNA glycosylase [Pirellulaceae bacterium]
MTNQQRESLIGQTAEVAGYLHVLASYLEVLRRFGVTHLPCPKSVTKDPVSYTANEMITLRMKEEAAAITLTSERSVSIGLRSVDDELKEATAMSARKQKSDSDSASRLAVIEKEVAVCKKCTHLAQARHNTVFGMGNPRARLCFVGEAPGAEEDKQGIPFVGRAGQLLDTILGACRLSRSDVYILNTIKCRPPNNRNPNEEEIRNCWGYALRQLEVLQPEFICCLGTVAAQTVLKTSESIGRLRGRFHAFGEIKVIATYHPAYLLRNPEAKKHVWEDMKQLLREMGTPID